jgi:hypothetical protein
VDKNKAALATIGIILAGALSVVASTAAASVTGGAAVREGTLGLTSASVEKDGASFYDQATLATAWEASVEAFDRSLPSGYRLSVQSSADFEKLGSGQSLFEAQIVDMSVATDYRCAWLDAGLSGKATTAQVQKALATYWTLPSVAEFDQTGLDTDLEKISAELGYKDQNKALFDLTCNGWEK